MEQMPRGKFLNRHIFQRFDRIDSFETERLKKRHEAAFAHHALQDYQNLKFFGELDNQFRDEEEFLIAQIQYFLEGYWTEGDFLQAALQEEVRVYKSYDSRLKKLRSMRKSAKYVLGATG